MELYLAFQMAQAALSGIRSCCDMLSTGSVEIKRIKKGVEDAKGIIKDVSGFWGWLTALFKPSVPKVVADTPEPKKKADEYIDYIPTEDDVSEQFFGHLIDFMEAQTIILDDISARKEELLNHFNPKQNNRIAAAKLIKDERKINQMAMEFSELLSGAPKILGGVYSDFKEKYPVVVQAQERAKERLRITRQQESWRREEEHHQVVDLAIGMFLTMSFVLWLWAIWIKLFTRE